MESHERDPQGVSLPVLELSLNGQVPCNSLADLTENVAPVARAYGRLSNSAHFCFRSDI